MPKIRVGQDAFNFLGLADNGEDGVTNQLRCTQVKHSQT